MEESGHAATTREKTEKTKERKIGIRNISFSLILKKYWTAIAVIIIVFLGFYVRVDGYSLPYLRNIDSYAFYRQINDIVKNGVFSLHDDLILAPDGLDRQLDIFPYQYLGAYSYMFIRIFIPGLELWRYLIYFPALLAALLAIPMYFIGKTLYDKKAGVLAAFFIVLDISIMSRSLGGDPDTDAITILMALLSMAIFLKTYKYLNEKKKLDKKGLIYTVLTGVTLGIFSHTWVGYWYVVWLITGLILLKFITDSAILKSIKTAWHTIKHVFYSYLLIMAILILLFIIPFYGISSVISIFSGPIEFQSIKTEEGREFPNVYVSVAEMQESGGIKDIIERTSAIGGIAILLSPFFLMIYAILYLVYSFYKTHKHIDTVILLLIWFIGPLSATIIAVRFSILFAAPMAIGSSILLSKILRMITGEDKKIED
ncbi:MAG: hypothetical protein NT129_01105 [Candidatus Aenigmarchaeota archaeon]|nr:hypothetical protein [Candidatus Aenigmarchaeota archaeon]